MPLAVGLWRNSRSANIALVMEKSHSDAFELLNAEFGKGFSADTLENARGFYLCY